MEHHRCHLTIRSSGPLRVGTVSSTPRGSGHLPQALDRMEMASLASLGRQWRRAALELGIEFQGPYTLVAADGARFEFACLLPQFGAERGMLLGATYDKVAAEAAAQAGFGFSYLDAENSSERFELSGYIECLRDWGWSAKRERLPNWYAAEGRNAV